MENQLKIGIVGLGPVGMVLATHLQEAGCHVIVCDVDRIKINLIRHDGIRLTNVIEKHSRFESICTSVSELASFRPDILLFATKVNFMPFILQEAVQLKEQDIIVISAQNGIDSEEIIAEYFGRDNTLRMVINFAGNLNAKNITKVTFFNPPNHIASIDGSKQKEARLIAELFRSVQLDTEAVDSEQIQSLAWKKTILNASLSPLCAVARLTMAEAMSDPDTNDLIRKTIEEAVEVAAAEGHRYGSDFIETCMGYLEKAGHHFPSLATDYINNRPTEIDFFNGKIVEYGRKHHIPTPINLSFTNTIKAVTKKHVIAPLIHPPGPDNRQQGIKSKGPFFIGIDLGSAYTKISVMNKSSLEYKTLLPSQSSRLSALQQTIHTLQSEFDVKYICATGYGRRHLPQADYVKTEINCAAKGVAFFHPGPKNIVDIGGEDIKVIKCDRDGKVENFYMNDKCAAGTGAFIAEIAERAEIDIREMSNLASRSNYSRELNSFCAVFAKTEIMNWMFEGVNIIDIAKGIYISIANRVAKLRIDPGLPVYMIGGVIDHHPFIKDILAEKLHLDVRIVDYPQYVVSIGAALIAQEEFILNKPEIIRK